MTILRAKTTEGYTIKVLAELLQNVIRIACLEVTKEGIKMRMMDSQRKVLFDIDMHHSKFHIFELEGESPLFIGLNLGHLYKMLKIIKKKDGLMMSIDRDDPSSLHLVVYPYENNRISRSFIKIHLYQQINVPLPTGYTHSIMIPSNEYQRTIKDMNNISDTIIITTRRYSVSIATSSQGIYSRDVLFGELSDESPIEFREEFDIEQFARIVKIAGLSKYIQVCGGEPLLLKTNIGQLGTMSIYIKTKGQLRSEEISRKSI